MEAHWVQFQPFSIRRTAARVEPVHPQRPDKGSRKTIFAAKGAKKDVQTARQKRRTVCPWRPL